MPPILALVLSLGFTIWCFRQDTHWRKLPGFGAVLAWLWLALHGSRPLSYWMNLGITEGAEASSVNTLGYAFFLIAALYTLHKRGLNWLQTISMNKALFMLYGFMALSAFWSEVPFVSFKRLIKDFAAVLIALVILTDVAPAQVLRTVAARVAYLLFPLSVVFIHYYPSLGRNFSKAGGMMFTGVTTQKNSLGQLAMVFGLLILWDLLDLRRSGIQRPRWRSFVLWSMLGIAAYLVIKSNSATALACMVMGTVLLFGGRWLASIPQGRALLNLGLVAAVALFLLDGLFGLSGMVLKALNRDATLTGRTEIWRQVIEKKTDPLIGVGYYTFWDSTKGREVTETFAHINSAHNGYLELYLEGGIIACVLLGGLLLAGGKRISDRLFSGHPSGVLGLSAWTLLVVYNWSESSFMRLDLLWFLYCFSILEVPVSPAELAAEEHLVQESEAIETGPAASVGMPG